MAQRAEVWVTCRAVIEIPCGPYDLRTSFDELSRSAESEAKAKLSMAIVGSRLAPKGCPTVIGYRADLEGALTMAPSPLAELERRDTTPVVAEPEFTDASKECGAEHPTGSPRCTSSQGHPGQHNHHGVRWG